MCLAASRERGEGPWAKTDGALGLQPAPSTGMGRCPEVALQRRRTRDGGGQASFSSLSAPIVHRRPASSLSKTSPFVVKSTCQEACILGLFQNRLANSTGVRTTSVLSVDQDLNRAPWK